ncbi:hypothetical protein RB595_004613 [Gaeumannomyces hyphopodioides]
MMGRGLTWRAPGLSKIFQAVMPAAGRGDQAPRWRRAFASDTTGGGGSGTTNPPKAFDSMLQLGSLLPSGTASARISTRIDDSSLDHFTNTSLDEFERKKTTNSGKEPWHFHIFSHKHNTHITITTPDRSPVISLSCGNLGFKKSGRKHYDSAYQLGAYVIDKLQQMGKHKDIDQLEICMRGFGPGRDAVTKILLGNEGRLLRPKIIRVSDSTRLKFGGTRSKKPRRLG